MVFVMETKNKKRKLDRIRRSINMPNAFYVDPVGQSGSLAVWWLDSINIMISHADHNLIRAIVSFAYSTLQWHAFFVYGSNNCQVRRTFWNNIIDDISYVSAPVLVIGDFNVVGEVADKKGGNLNISTSIEELQGFINGANLMEIPFKGISYTWTNNREESNNIRERIDRVLVNAYWMELYPLCLLSHEPLIGSDHTPLILNTEPRKPFRKRFRFETMWTRSDQCEPVIRSSWKQSIGCPSDVLQENLESCRTCLTKWSKECFGNNKLLIKSLTDRLRVVQKYPPTEANRKLQHQILEQIDELEIREEMYWHQRAGVNWINYGDANTRFFHLTASYRKQRNRIFKIRDANDQWLSDVQEIKEAVRNHFQDIFKSVGNRDFSRLISLIPRIISEDMNHSLCKEVTDAKILRAVNQLGPLKAPGKDGFPAFIPGRQIQDSIVVAHECFHHITHKKKGSVAEMAIKLDLNKAFDRVEWDFLLAIMNKMGFDSRWQNWIFQCISTTSLDFFINDEEFCSLKPQKGVRQGDSISPYLFLLIVDVLSRSLLNAIQDGSLSGIKMARQCPEVSHILFADDSLIFLHANELVAVIFSPNTSNDLKGKILEVLKIPESSEKGKYLGVPAVLVKNKLEMFNYIKERALKKMQGWKQKLISQAGREILIKHVVQAIPSYSMSCFLLPQKLINKIMMAVRNFWWGGDPSSRNNFVFNNDPICPHSVLRASSFAQSEFLSLLQSSSQVSHSSVNNSSLQWTPPPLNLVKFNCDGAFKQGAAAIGVIGRNSEGKLVDGRASRISAISSFQSELFAIREACLIARQNHLLNAIIESDCKEAIKLCSSDLAPPWDSAVLIEDIRSVVSEFQLKLSFVPRSCNGAALAMIMPVKKACGEIIFNINKEAAARVIVSEQKTVAFQKDLDFTKQQTHRMLLRAKQMFDSATSEAEITSLNQSRRIAELEAQHNETEEMILDLRAEISQANDQLDTVKSSNVYSRSLNEKDNFESKEPQLYRNGCTQRIRAFERNLLEEKLLNVNLANQLTPIKSDTDKEHEHKVEACALFSSNRDLEFDAIKNIDRLVKFPDHSSTVHHQPVKSCSLQRKKSRNGKAKATLNSLNGNKDPKIQQQSSHISHQKNNSILAGRSIRKRKARYQDDDIDPSSVPPFLSRCKMNSIKHDSTSDVDCLGTESKAEINEDTNTELQMDIDPRSRHNAEGKDDPLLEALEVVKLNGNATKVIGIANEFSTVSNSLNAKPKTEDPTNGTASHVDRSSVLHEFSMNHKKTVANLVECFSPERQTREKEKADVKESAGESRRLSQVARQVSGNFLS
ncbi:hypothetical protein AgCh_012179 [Apium graveolens]